MLAFFLDSHTDHYDLDDKKQLTWDMAEAMNLELRQLVASGCKVIQIEEPTLHFIACYYPEMTKLLDFLVDCFNREIEGLDDVEIWIHTCWGNPNMQKVFSDESYANSIEIYLDRLKGDVWTIEATENDLKELPLFAPYKDSLKKKIAVGVISHRTLQADFPEVRRRPDPPRARVHPGRQARPLDRLRLRPPGLQPAPRVLQGGGDPAGAQHRAQGARPRRALHPGRRTRGSPGTSSPTTSRSPT